MLRVETSRPRRSRGRVAFVSPRYGRDVVGGSERLMREAAHGLARRGWDVELLTTWARDHYSWHNEYGTGSERIEDGVLLHRFPLERPSSDRVRAELEERIRRGDALPTADELAWLDSRFRAPALFHHLVMSSEQYDAVVLSPYASWTTVTGATVAPDRTVVLPCLHDEPYARLDVLRSMLSETSTLWFLSEPEHALGHRITRLPHRHPVTGAGVTVPDAYDPEGFRVRYGLHNPYLLFAGRRERGKGWDWLLDAYAFAVTHHQLPIDLVTTGVGDVSIPRALDGRVIDLGFLDEKEQHNAFAAATAFVQPSPNESFSLTIMEAWLAGTPVLAADTSPAVTWHCERSGAGLVFADEFELAQALGFVAGAPEVAAELAARGRQYVLENYRWEIVLDRMESSLWELSCGSLS